MLMGSPGMEQGGKFEPDDALLPNKDGYKRRSWAPSLANAIGS
jgi:hypothetical protein